MCTATEAGSGSHRTGRGRRARVFVWRHVTPVMAPETRTRRALGWPIVPPLEVRVALEEIAVVPVAEHVVPRAAAAQALRGVS